VQFQVTLPKSDEMKKLLIFTLLAISTLSCEKNNLFPESEIPDWLKTQIEISEQQIQENPGKMPAFGAWVRFIWKTDCYFEYYNPVSSLLYEPISFDGVTLKFTDPKTTDYHKEKCCMRYVWKGPNYIAF